MKMLGLPVHFVKFSIRSKQAPLLALVVAGVITALVWSVNGFVSSRSSAHGVNPAKKEQRGCCSDQPATPRRMIGTYYTTEDGFQSTLILNNKGPNTIMVTPILHSRDGQTNTSSLVAVGGQSSSEVDLNLLASIAGPQYSSGSFEFTYQGRLVEVGGGLRIVNAEKSLVFDEQMLEPGMKFPTSRLEAVYAIPFEDSQASVIVTNTTAQPVTVNGVAVFAGANGHHPIDSALGPYETQVVNLPRGLVKKASAGAVSLKHNGVKGALLAKIHLHDADRGYSESVNFASPGGRTTERHGAGLRLGSVGNDALRPVIAVRNIGEVATTVTATVPYSKLNGDTGEIELRQVSLAPGAIKLLDTSNPQLRRNDFATAGLEIKYTGAPGSVLATASSVSQSGNHVFALPMKDPKVGLSSTGGYPWFIKETSSTVVLIKNVTDEPQEFMLSIVYTGGQWGSDIRILAPGQTFALDVRKLRDSQEKGLEGKVVPLGATSGHVSWSFRGKKDKVLIGRAQTVDTANGLVSTYECQCVCPWNPDESRITPASLSVQVGYTSSYTLQTHMVDCNGNDKGWHTITSDFSLFSSNPGVANWNDGDLTATAFAPGQTWLGASWQQFIGHPEPIDFGVSECVIEESEGGAEANCEVQAPQVTDVSAQGATKVTSVVGNQSIIHFVTPKGALGEKVTLTATISPSNPESINQVSWTGATQDSTNRLKATVPKGSAGKTVVTIRVGGQVAKELRVWIVWATTTVPVASTVTYEEPATINFKPGAFIRGKHGFLHTIAPSEIITDNDRPDLSGDKSADPPGDRHPWFGDPLSGGATKKWDSSRQFRCKILKSGTIANDDFSQPPPVNVSSYPSDGVEGNDDTTDATDEINDPYGNSGKLIAADNPGIGIAHSAGSDNDTYELRLHFREFARLEIAGTWYRISDYFLWKYHIKFKKVAGKWINDGSAITNDNEGF